jgi:hypothetical protein
MNDENMTNVFPNPLATRSTQKHIKRPPMTRATHKVTIAQGKKSRSTTAGLKQTDLEKYIYI